MSPSLLIIDLDGTLADTAPDLVNTLNRIITPLDLKPVSVGQIGQHVGHGAKAMIERAYELNDQPLPNSQLDTLFDQFLADYEARMTKGIDSYLFPGMTAALDELELNNWKFAICTNKMHRMAESLLEQLDVRNRFLAVIGGDSFDFKKPDPRHLEETAKLAGFNLNDAIMLGDTATDINAAKNASIPSIAVTFGYSDVPVKKLGADRIISSCDQLAETVMELARTETNPA